MGRPLFSPLQAGRISAAVVAGQRAPCRRKKLRSPRKPGKAGFRGERSFFQRRPCTAGSRPPPPCAYGVEYSPAFTEISAFLPPPDAV